MTRNTSTSKSPSKSKVSDKEGLFVKSIRADGTNDFWWSFAYSITISNSTRDEKWRTRRPLRVGLKKRYGWRHAGAYAPGEDDPLHPRETKQYHSKHQSTSYVRPDEDYFPKIFGHDKR